MVFYVSDMIDAKGELRGTAELRKDTISLPEQDREKLLVIFNGIND